MSIVSGKAVRLDELSEQLFRDVPKEISSGATDTLLALGCYAKDFLMEGC